MATTLIERIANGRTDLAFEWVARGGVTTATDDAGTSLIQWCAYHGDVSAIRFLLTKGESLASLGPDLGLNAAAFHGHWRLCQFLLEQGAAANRSLLETGETPLHSALCRANRPASDVVVAVLLASGADPNAVAKSSAPTGAFMRDARTRGETPLHRAAAFGSEEAIRLLLEAGAKRDARDANGDTPLSWASWHLRPDSVLRALCYGEFTIHSARDSKYDHGRGWGALDAALLGTPIT